MLSHSVVVFLCLKLSKILLDNYCGYLLWHRLILHVERVKRRAARWFALDWSFWLVLRNRFFEIWDWSRKTQVFVISFIQWITVVDRFFIWCCRFFKLVVVLIIVDFISRWFRASFTGCRFSVLEFVDKFWQRYLVVSVAVNRPEEDFDRFIFQF